MIAPQSDGIRVLVVDDEAPARLRLIDLLRQDAQVKAVMEASDGEMAVRMILSERPDLVLLDVQMPEFNGMEVVDKIGAERMPLTVFVTAYDQHAIRAFEANALDYLLKPFSDERLEAMLIRVKARRDELHLLQFGKSVAQVMATSQAPRRYWYRLAVKSEGITRFVRIKDIDWIEAAGVYVNLHVSGKGILHRASLNELGNNLDPAQFVRIHRSAVVNIECIVQMEQLSHGEFEVLLKGGSRLRVSRTYRTLLEQRLGQVL
jgi:two-component system LytT family response regulator